MREIIFRVKRRIGRRRGFANGSARHALVVGLASEPDMVLSVYVKRRVGSSLEPRHVMLPKFQFLVPSRVASSSCTNPSCETFVSFYQNPWHPRKRFCRSHDK